MAYNYTFGSTWWGKEWLNALNHIDYSNRLPRGRRYAKNGSVTAIELKGNIIEAEVQGTRPWPYEVKFAVPEFSVSEKERIVELITANPLFLSQLLNRVLPESLNNLCSSNGIDLFPKSWNSLSGSCSCPDWAVPCKHMAAVLYLVANEIDKNPFLVFELHNFDLFEGLEHRGYTTSGQAIIETLTLGELMEPVSDDIPEPTWDEAAYQKIDFSTITESKDRLLSVLGENPVFFPEGDFKSVLNKVYTSTAKQAAKWIEMEDPGDPTLLMAAIAETALTLDSDMDFLNCTFSNVKGETLLSFNNFDDLLEWLTSFNPERLADAAISLRLLMLAMRFADKLVVQSSVVPQLIEVRRGQYRIRWLPALLIDEVRAVFDLIGKVSRCDVLFYKKGRKLFKPGKDDALASLMSVFIDPFFQAFHGLDHKFESNEICALFFKGSLETFEYFENQAYPAAIQLWLNRFYLTEKKHVPVIVISDANNGFDVSVAIENKKEPLALPVPLDKVVRLKKYASIRVGVLRDIAVLAEYFPQISELVSVNPRERLFVNRVKFPGVLFGILPVIRLLGIRTLLPKGLRHLLKPQLSMKLERVDDGVVNQGSLVGLANLLQFQWQLALGDQMLSKEEFLAMIGQFSGIVKLKDTYVYIDEKEIQSLIRQLEDPPAINDNQLLQIALSEDYDGATVVLDKKVRQLIGQMLDPEKEKVPEGLNATLRPYQENGFSWLYKNSKLGFGSLIADDMGLGKTIQVITALIKLKAEGTFSTEKGLIIVPTTLLTNWQKEILRFGPGLLTHVYHGPSRDLSPLDDADLLITTYGVVRSESAKLQKIKWAIVIIDEAQNIKNPGTAQTRAVKKLEAPVRIAMTGTPVENRLSEYWSIFDFINKGYLDSLNKFKENYARPIEVDRDKHQLDKFLRITSPFILRRVKTDKSIIKDLPDKIEKNQFCQLTPDQAALYQSVLDNTLEAIEKTDGIDRKGLILKLITALKQICNHPVHFLKKGDPAPDQSGKCILLFDLLRQILEANEKVLLFTQYRELGELLLPMLKAEFGLDVPFLHGGVSRKKRDEMVEIFQTSRHHPVFLLSLKAGGTGLNLTSASNVIHYDLWWNPAVETQATDRAYRIGQTKNVMVHRFITQGTFEEKIDRLLQSKRELANLTVSSGEKWIGDMSDAELRNLVSLD